MAPDERTTAATMRTIHAAGPPSWRRIYAEVPRVRCEGKCPIFCHGTIGMHTDELGAIARHLRDSALQIEIMYEPGSPMVAFNPRVGVLPVPLQPDCPILREGRCMAYHVRPMICRLWGAIDCARCPWGCAVDPRPLTPREAYRLLMLAMGWREDAIAASFEQFPDAVLRSYWEESVRMPEEAIGG